MTTFYEWEESFFSSMKTERYGQAFMCQYMRNYTWSELFYADTVTARNMIVQWLMDNHYWPNMPDTNNQLDVMSKAS